MAGLSARDAAEIDGVSVDTKRVQIKSLCAKMECSGQADLIRLIIGQLVLVVALANSESHLNDDAEAFLARYLAEDVTLAAHRLPNGRVLRVLECGRPDATPVSYTHLTLPTKRIV